MKMRRETNRTQSNHLLAFLATILTSVVVAAALGDQGLPRAQAADRDQAGPSVQHVRLRVPLNSGWRFKRQAAPGAAKPEYDDSLWTTVHLPHTWDATAENPFTWPGHFRGLGWYRRAFDAPVEWRDKRMHVEFKGVFQIADVWVNGRHAGRHVGGYTGFTLDVTDFVQWGAKNLLAVRVNDVLDASVAPANETNVADYGGIYRSVALVVTNLIHFPSNAIHVQVERTPAGGVIVHVTTRIENPDSSTHNGWLETAVLDEEGKTLAALHQDFRAEANRVIDLEQTTEPIADPRLWLPDTPYLYRLTSTIDEAARPSDRVETLFGIRFMDYDPASGFTMNGTPINLRGVNRRQDYGFLGDAVPEAVGVRDVRLMKEMGANFLRTSHYPQDPAVLDACDRLGILVWEEIPNIKIRMYPPAPDNTERVYTERFPRALMGNLKQQLREMIERDSNHPSIIIWGLGDDLSRYHYPEDFVELVNAAHLLDPSRWTAARSPHVTDITDATSEDHLVHEHEQHPERKYIWNEWGSFASQRGTEGLPYYLRLPADPLGDVSIPDSDAALLMEGYLMQWNALPWLGTAKWCMFDTGEPNATRTRTLWDWPFPDGRVTFRWPFDDYLGVADMWRLPKEGYYFLESQWTEKPMVHIVGHWSWPSSGGLKPGTGNPALKGGVTGQVTGGLPSGNDANTRRVRVYSNCDTVELFLNGKSLGIRKPESNRRLWADFRKAIGPYQSPDDFNQQPLSGANLRHPPFIWDDVPYESGKLTAIGRKGDATVKDEVRTAGQAAGIVLKAEKETIAADDEDVSFIEADVVDARGAVVPDARPWIVFAVEGPGRLLGGTSEVDAIAGKAAINVQSAGPEGEIVVTATSPGLEPGLVRLRAVK